MKRILIIGGGYAGLTAACRLAQKARGTATVRLIDQREAHQALPLLPDIVGRGFRTEGLRYAFAPVAERFGFEFCRTAVRSLDPPACAVDTEDGSEHADALIVATGTRTAYHGLDFAEHYGLPLDTTEDGERIRDTLLRERQRPVVVCGGGYTGVELATAVRRMDRRQKIERSVLIVDLADALCSAIPARFQRYVSDNVRRMGLDVRTGTSVADANDRGLTLSNGEEVQNGLLLWSAGVGAPPFIRELDVEKTKQGRLFVDPSLRIAERCFVAGDAAAFRHKGEILRMSIQFALSQGRCAADNALRILQGDIPRPFTPRDPGYIVPMANNRACGPVLGCPVFGRKAIMLHFLMCAARSMGNANRRRVAADAFRSLLGHDRPPEIS